MIQQIDHLERRLYGLPVIINDTLAKKQRIALSAACPCSIEMRSSFNNYLAELFGYHHEIIRVENTLIMSSFTYKELLQQIKKGIL